MAEFWNPTGHHARATTTSLGGANPHSSPVSGPTQSPTSAALDHPETEQEWADVIDGPMSTQQSDHAAGTDRGHGGAAFVDPVQAGTIS